jgi:hypothetical protein
VRVRHNGGSENVVCTERTMVGSKAIVGSRGIVRGRNPASCPRE